MSRARLAYTLVWLVALPLVALYLLWRSLRQREYRDHWSERFGGRGATPPGAGPVVWLHAVSVGETRAAQPLIEALMQQRADLRVVLTHMTPTGRAVGAALAARWPGRLVQRYLPYELPWALARFLREVRPAVGVIMETEVWPNLLATTRARQVPVVLVNARLSDRSLARALRFPALMREAARGFTTVLAQSSADAERLRTLYDGPIEVIGNLKFDLRPADDLLARGRALREALGARPVWLLASSRDGEEALVLDALASLGHAPGREPILLVVPRHPQRFDEVARLIEAQGFACLRRSRAPWQAPSPRTVLLGNTMGEMPLYFAAADLTLMGGSLLPFGAQNLIESCAVGTPVVLGPSVYNFAQAAADAVAAGAAVQVTDAAAALRMLAQLSADADRLQAMRHAAAAFAQAHRGATERTVARLLALLGEPRGATAAPSLSAPAAR
ncbi:MAG: lipid IV(A) 3-deoxy-D-manno-octulosonic acid transferase [Burkholderiaceae bacterium]|nr:lipid IV(A) 3-deoxy-D-manno-octulosonic acid transferase [Burkholderiaceae bacterium]